MPMHEQVEDQLTINYPPSFEYGNPTFKWVIQKSPMESQLLYRDLAPYYDLIYAAKDYKNEAMYIKDLISQYKTSTGNDLLDVACGTGNHLNQLKNEFSCTGVDINQEILHIAQKNVTGVTFIKGDMTTVDLNKKFDVVLCLFSSIGYARTYEKLRKTLFNFAAHTKSGGVVIVEPWLTKADFSQGLPHMTVYDGEDIKIARLSTSRIQNNISIIDMHYLIAEKDKEIKYVAEQHELGLFDIDKTLTYMGEAKLKAEFLEKGLTGERGILVGVKVKS